MNWSSLETRLMSGPNILEEMEQEVKNIRNNLKAAQDTQNVYEYQKRTFQ